ncbi:hepatic lectin [Drosophila kikkawai]|uniref:Hepatic lectin n=1 Tax=Drosophila kikkawai TaxID=30033 RepID=A0A6P4HWK7_DROKI|nr:C-type lectin 37Db [Drosophila kikkawai]
MRCFIIFCILTIYLSKSHSAGCVGDECQTQCAAYCFGVLSPCMSNLAILQKRTEACEAAVTIARIALTDKRLETFGAPLTSQQDRENRSQLLLPANLTKKAETFMQLGTKFYYIEKELKLNWHDALGKCHKMGGHLASPQNQEELDAFNNRLSGLHRYWIDVTNQFKEDEYVSFTTASAAKFLRWAEGEPTKDGKCVDIRTYNGKTTMNDNTCSVNLYFICEKSNDL